MSGAHQRVHMDGIAIILIWDAISALCPNLLELECRASQQAGYDV